ncbi:MAG: FAD-dependent oxidoreductase [Candidatus Aminicenantales bacterium]
MIRHDILVVGGGLAGLSAALNSDPDLSVAVVSKVHPLRSHSVAAQGGINAALGNSPEGKDDTWERHAFDTIKGSDYLADQTSAELLCQLAIPMIYELDALGVPFSRFPGGVIAQRPFGGAGFPRTCYAADRTGLVILHTLSEHAIRRNVRFYDEWLVTRLVVRDGRCLGVVVCDLASGDVFPIQARSVIFATGGYGRVYLKTTNAFINHGSGIGIAYRAGVPLKDMEFVQFHPTSLFGKNILITEGARGEGGHLLNNKGRRFMEDYAPSSMELAPRDIVARAIQTEIDKGNGFEGEFVHLDLRPIGEEKIKKRLPGIREICIHFAGIDPVDTPIPIQPAQHYSMGGIDVDETSASVVEGFFAAGECACVSVHGANRLGGNSLLETVVYGKVAGQEASKRIPQLRENPTDVRILQEEAAAQKQKILGWHHRDKGPKVHILMNRLKVLMSDRVGIFRHGEDLRRAVETIQELREEYQNVRLSGDCLRYSQELVNIIEFESMLDLAEVIALGALNREETRGSHYRTDFPKRDDANWLKHTVISLEEGRVRIQYKPVRIDKYEPKERTY